jgi:type VI secretion system secreted protein VgrG
VNTPLGDDVLLLTGFMGSEAISQLFHFELEMVSEQESIPFDSLIGKNVSLRVRLADGTDRYFNGFISRFSQGGRDHDFTYYRAEMVPWLWFLTRIVHCRIFQEKTVPEIVEAIFKDNGFQDYSLKLYRQCVPREYCVQYRETDFHFISRLMEEEGIFYFFKHENGKHTLILGDAPTAHEDCPYQASARYEITAGGWQDDDVITDFRVEHELRSSKYSQRDFNFETPSNHLEATVGGENFSIYDFQQGQYKVRGDGDTLTRIRLQETQAPAVIGYGASDCRAFTSGYKFNLKEHYRDDLNQAYVLISVQHSGRQGGDYRSGGDADFHYSNSFECLPHATPYRPARATPRPLVHGAETAIVTGPSGEEIYTDKHGRVKVQFHWDRDGKMDEHSSCWIRVAQLWAGKSWGAMFIPRTGQEVIVEFLQGNPDQPIITGRVYNGEQPPPYPLPAQQTKSTIKSLSSKGGGGFNELRF